MADGDAGTALTLMMSATRSFISITHLTDELTNSANNNRDHKVAGNDAALDRQTTLLIAIVVIMIGVGGAASLLIGRGISRPVMGIAAAVKRMAEGDFDTALPGLGRKDEIGEIAAAVEAIKVKAAAKARRKPKRSRRGGRWKPRKANGAGTLRPKLRNGGRARKAAEEQAQVLSMLAAGLESLSAGDLTVRLERGHPGDLPRHQGRLQRRHCGPARDHRLDRGGRDPRGFERLRRDFDQHDDLSQRTEEQAASLEETSASMEEITATVKQNAENAACQPVGRGTREVADRGGQVVAKAVGAMAQIEDRRARSRTSSA